MDCAALLQPIFSSLASPSSRRSSFFIGSPSTGRFASTNRSGAPLVLPVVAQARRGASLKEDEVASHKLKQLHLFPTSDLQFEPPLKIVEYPDLILRAKNKRIDTFNDNFKKLVHEMLDVMYKTDGIGLSPPQVGINVQLMVFNPIGERREGEEIVLVNPRVSRYSKKMLLFNEGCLSFPRINADVRRPESVKVTDRAYQKVDAPDVNRAGFTVNLSGLPAWAFQHEFDHLQGVLFFDRMTERVLDHIHEQLQALEKKYENKTGFPSPERIDETCKKKKVAVGFGKSS